MTTTEAISFINKDSEITIPDPELKLAHETLVKAVSIPVSEFILGEKLIKVSEEMYDFLMSLSKEVNSQDHRATAMPYIFQVETQEEVIAVEGNGSEVWVCDDSRLDTEEEITNSIAEHKEIEPHEVPTDWLERETILEEMGYRKIYLETKAVYQNHFFTEKACKEHIERNKHRYSEPECFLSHASRNPELEMLYTFITELTGCKIHK